MPAILLHCVVQLDNSGFVYSAWLFMSPKSNSKWKELVSDIVEKLMKAIITNTLQPQHVRICNDTYTSSKPCITQQGWAQLNNSVIKAKVLLVYSKIYYCICIYPILALPFYMTKTVYHSLLRSLLSKLGSEIQSIHTL